ncbi:MAG: DUF6599 family protein [Thermodesulfobacteriota bacterium]|nr:DUF6599 family protein [Thermodesulfobacteriota bacterium]
MKRKNTIFAVIVLALTTSLSNAQRLEDRSQKKVTEYKKTLRILLPKNGEINGCEVNSDPQFFGPQNLWEYINGQAEMYLDYGFELVTTAEYTTLDGFRSMTIEIYRMRSPKHAFGIYAAERSPHDSFIKIGVQGYLSENALNFWKGDYYVKLASHHTSSETKKILIKLALDIDNKIEGSYYEPKLFACFPESNRIKMSERFIPKNFLGMPFLRDGYRVDYEREGSSYQVFLVRNGSHDIAREVFRKYQDFLKSQAERVSHTKKYDYQLIFTKKEKAEVMFQYGPFVGGVLYSTDRSKAEEIIEEIVRKLRRGCS